MWANKLEIMGVVSGINIKSDFAPSPDNQESSIISVTEGNVTV